MLGESNSNKIEYKYKKKPSTFEVNRITAIFKIEVQINNT